MRTRRGPVNRLLSIRDWFQRFAFFILVVAAAGLIALSRLNAPWAEAARTGVMDAVAPVVDAMSMPVKAISGWFNSFEDMDRIKRENARLKAEVVRLRLREMEADRLETDNKRLRKLVDAPPRVTGRHVVARVIADPGGLYRRAFIVQVGRKQGVRRGLAVINEEGLIGRVIEVGDRASRILLLTDLNSRIPVMIEASGERAVLAGTNEEFAKLVFVRHRTEVKRGARIVTSGHGGIFPPGLPIGDVVEIDKRRILVRPYVSWSRVGYVRIIDYSTEGLVPAPAGSSRLGARKETNAK